MNTNDANLDNINLNNTLVETNELQDQYLSLSPRKQAQTNSENEINILKQRIDYYEKHLSILISKYQETTNKFIVFRDFFLNYQNGQPNDIKIVLEKIKSIPNAEENSQLASLIEENSQLHVNFKRSTNLLKQQKEIILKLKNNNKELNSILEKVSKNEFASQRIDELEKENKDLQSLYEMMVNESDDLNAKNQTLNNQIEVYKSNENKLKIEQKILHQKIIDIEEELAKLKLSNNDSKNSNNYKAALDISSSFFFFSPEESQNDIKVRFPTKKSDCDTNNLIEELEVKSNYLESELNRTAEDLNKMIKQNDILKQDHRKHWISLKNAKEAIAKYKEIENILRGKLESAGIDVPHYDLPIFEETPK